MGESLCDLTGGLGIDTFYFSKQIKDVIYTERFPAYCDAAQHNFDIWQAHNILIQNKEAETVAQSIKVDTFYLDPARRGNGNKRMFALADCEPNVLALKPILLENAKRVILKVSPMADVMETLRLLPETKEIHIVSVKNECKELLFILENELQQEEPTVITVNFTTTEEKQYFQFQYSAERKQEIVFAKNIRKYLYEPNSSLLKAGAFKLLAEHFAIEKLHQHSHLYTSDSWIEDFPGRKFIVDNTFEFSGKLLKQLSRTLPQANITTRNFNLSVSELRERSKIVEGGNIYLFATTLQPKCPILIQCRK